MMRTVKRLFRQFSSSTVGESKPLAAFLSHPAIVILGEPGAGKTTTFRLAVNEEPNAKYCTVRDFLTYGVHRWKDRVLYLDALDEQRSTSANGKHILDQIRTKLDDLGIPPFRLSCRAADWYGSTDVEPLKGVSANGDVLVLQLEPLSDEDIIEIVSDILSDPHGFLLQAKARDLSELLVNPQTLEMVARVVSGGKWPETRTDLYQRASEILASETNAAHMPDSAPLLTSVT
jgi:hypothetical protein